MDRDALKSTLEPIFRKHDAVVLAYLIGSAARGDMHDRSDLDFAVLLRDDSVDVYKALWVDLHNNLAPPLFDLAVLNGADPVFSFEVIREGVPFFYRSLDELNTFERRTWGRYADTRHLRAIGDYYRDERAREWLSRENVRARMKRFDEVIAQLERCCGQPLDEFLDDTDRQWVVERGFILAAECVGDIAAHILSGQFSIQAVDHEDAVQRLAEKSVISVPLAAALRGFGGFRNILVHEYLRIDPARVHAYLENELDSLHDFAAQIAAWLKG